MALWGQGLQDSLVCSSVQPALPTARTLPLEYLLPSDLLFLPCPFIVQVGGVLPGGLSLRGLSGGEACRSAKQQECVDG